MSKGRMRASWEVSVIAIGVVHAGPSTAGFESLADVGRYLTLVLGDYDRERKFGPSATPIKIDIELRYYPAIGAHVDTEADAPFEGGGAR